MMKSYVLCMGVANVHVKKNQGLAFHRTGDRREALLCPIVMKSVTNKHPNMWNFVFLGRLTNTLRFSVEFNIKKNQKQKGSLRQRTDPLPNTQPTFSLWPFPTGVLHAIESLFSKFSDWPNLPGRAKCGRWWRRERMGICTWIWQCGHSCALSGKNSECEESNACVLPKSNESVRRGLLSWASPFELEASRGFCATTYFLVGV